MCVCVVFVFRNNLHSVEAIKIVVGEKKRARGAVKGFYRGVGKRAVNGGGVSSRIGQQWIFMR